MLLILTLMLSFPLLVLQSLLRELSMSVILTNFVLCVYHVSFQADGLTNETACSVFGDVVLAM